MRVFDFAAFNSSGKSERGTVRAWSFSEAKRKIQERGFYLASITIHGTSSPDQNSFSFFRELKEFFFSTKKIRP
jgi:type II secretory pathway component PulF